MPLILQFLAFNLHTGTRVWETQAEGGGKVLWRCRRVKADALVVLS